MIEMKCPHCGKKLSIPEQYAGRSGTCNYCRGYVLVSRDAMGPEATCTPKITQGIAADLIGCPHGGHHCWPLGNDYNNPAVGAAWNDAGHARDWPLCEKCRMDLLVFIDLSDKPTETRVRRPLFREMMAVRHQWLVQALIADTRLHPLHWERPAEHWLRLDAPDHVLSIPGGYRGMVWPLLRMVGWVLWWQGGIVRMREACSAAHGFSLDLLWHQIGVGEQVWLA